MGRADYLSLGDWNAACFQCGRKRKASTMKKHWQGYYVCPEHWEPRHPQDFVRGVKENPSVPWSQPPLMQFVYPSNNTAAIAGIAISGLAVCGTGGTLNPPGATLFIDGQTLIQASWLNDVNTTVFTVVPTLLPTIVPIETGLDEIESNGWVTDTRVSNIGFNKFINKPTSLAGYGIVGGGTLIATRVFSVADTGSTYSPTVGTNKVVVEVIGGGGAGASHGATGPGNGAIGSGGTAGTYAIGFFTSGFAGVTITVGAGGIANKSDVSVGAGGDSSFGSLLSCPGGMCVPSFEFTNFGGLYPGFYSGSGTAILNIAGDSTGTKIFSVRGAPGTCGWGSIATGAIGGDGGDTIYGNGGRGTSTAESTGGDGSGYGSGGGSSWCANNSPSGYLGGNGMPGVVVVWEYA